MDVLCEEDGPLWRASSKDCACSKTTRSAAADRAAADACGFSNLKLTWRSKAYYATGAAEKELIAGADLARLQALVVETGSSFIQE